jgi:hypothetical protein
MALIGVIIAAPATALVVMNWRRSMVCSREDVARTLSAAFDGP